MKRLLLATNNPGKVRELRRLLEGCGFEPVAPADCGINLEVTESGGSYVENAALKAREFARAGDCLALADDSGLEVDALDGRPGVLSARYGGDGLGDIERNALLLRELAGLSAERRGARYRAVVAVASPDGELQTFEGVQEGRIAEAPRGEGGFGYDPVFLVDGERTQAELTPEEKDAISHRGKSVRAATAYLRGIG